MADIKLEWQGDTYTIKEDELFECGDLVENVLPLTKFIDMQITETMNTRKVASGVAAMINYAGGTVTAAAVHKEMMRSLGDGAGEITGYITALTKLLLDGMPAADDQPVTVEVAKKKSGS